MFEKGVIGPFPKDYPLVDSDGAVVGRTGSPYPTHGWNEDGTCWFVRYPLAETGMNRNGDAFPGHISQVNSTDVPGFAAWSYGPTPMLDFLRTWPEGSPLTPLTIPDDYWEKLKQKSEPPPPPAPVPRIYFAIGVARCGKSTYAQRWEEGLEMPEVAGHRVRWNQDSLRLSVHKERFNRHLEPLIHLLKPWVLGAHLEMDHVLFVDGTHTTTRSIKDLLELDINAQPVVFDVPVEVCRERAVQTDQSDLLPVIDRQRRQMDELLVDGVDALMSRLRREVLEERKARWGI